MLNFDLSSLPTQIQAIYARYRSTTGLDVHFKEVEEIAGAGNALAELKLLPQAVMKFKSSLSPDQLRQSIIHEFLHLELTMRGYPRLRVISDTNGDSIILMAHLESLFQHMLIFDVEKEFSYDPLVQEGNVAKSLLSQVSGISDFGPSENPDWHSRYCAWGAAFARILTFCKGSKEFQEVETLFANSNFSYAGTRARQMAEIAQTFDLVTAEKYSFALSKVLNEIVGGYRLKLAEPIFPLDA